MSVVDDDTEQAILALWAAAVQTLRDLVPVAVVDDDTERAVLSLWGTDVQLSELFKAPPRTGQQKSTAPGADIQATGPYVVLDCQLDHRELAYSDSKATSGWHDYRKVTLKVYGIRADVVAGAGLIMALFNRKLGAPNQLTLVYPSGARFMRWMPQGEARIEEDRNSKAGKDVWTATVEALVWSIRSE